jgi:hypothetical protein
VAEIWGYDVDQLVEMERDELGRVILRRFREHAPFHPMNVAIDAKDQAQRAGATYQQVQDLHDAVASACTWAKNEGYVVDDANASSGWQRVTKRGVAAASGAPTRPGKVTLLSPFSLHTLLDDAVSNFERGNLDAAVTLAMKAVEVGVRSAAGAASTRHRDSVDDEGVLDGRTSGGSSSAGI